MEEATRDADLQRLLGVGGREATGSWGEAERWGEAEKCYWGGVESDFFDAAAKLTGSSSAPREKLDGYGIIICVVGLIEKGDFDCGCGGGRSGYRTCEG